MAEKKLYKGIVNTNGEKAEYYTHAVDDAWAYQDMKRKHNYAYGKEPGVFVNMEIKEMKMGNDTLI